MSSPSLVIGGRIVGPAHPPYVIAEAGVHHFNSLELAKEYVLQAKIAGADAIKFQTYTAEKLVTRWAPTYWDTDGSSTQFDVFAVRSRLGEAAYAALFELAADLGIHLLSTPFDLGAADMLASLGMPAFKIASGDLTFTPLLKRAAGLQRPVLISTGAATFEEVRTGVKTLLSAGAIGVALLHCSLAYPTKVADANLRRIEALRSEFPDLVMGYSDHTVPGESELACPLAVGLGASIVEKHFTLNALLPEDDHYHAVDPAGLTRLVKNCRDAWKATTGLAEMTAVEEAARRGARRSIVAATHIVAGKRLEPADIDFKRPGTGLPPTSAPHVLGKRTLRAFEPDELIALDGLDDDR